MAHHANILIPDISGYTEFLTRTALDHSSHIINELLSVLVESNTSDLSLLEIEGDALLFCRKGEPIPVGQAIDQCTRMFTNFHNRLQSIERDTLCRCGACQKASNLTLKFIIHYGQISEITVSNFVKASGVDMVIAHRLLKNQLGLPEYILATEEYLRSQDPLQIPAGLSWTSADEDYPVVGRVSFRYTSLEGVRKAIPAPAEPEACVSCPCDESVSTDIAVPMMTVYEIMTDLEGRAAWIDGVRKSTADDPLGRLHSRHYCYFDDGVVEVIPVQRTISGNVIDYSEEIRIPGSDIPGITAFYHLKQIEPAMTSVQARVGSLNNDPLPAEAARFHLETMSAALVGLKKHCENRVVTETLS